MPDIRPFRGILYNPKKIKDVARVVTEPYDVISPSQKEAYYKLDSHNIIYLILGKQSKNDSKRSNQYTRARKCFALWKREHALVRDKNESIYIYSQTFSQGADMKTRTGFITLMKLEDFAKNSVLPHENTYFQPVQDRLRLLKTVRANLSPIFAIFGDEENKVSAILNHYKKVKRPCIVFKKDEILHKLWRMDDKKKIAKIRDALKDRQIFIADGHHRYEAALNYKKEALKKKRTSSNNLASNYVMTYLAATEDPGLTILPTHRVVKLNTLLAKKAPEVLKKHLQLKSFSSSKELFSYIQAYKGEARVFGMYAGEGSFYALLMDDTKKSKKIARSKKVGRNLDVSMLHEYIIEKFLGFTLREEDLFYTRDAQEAVSVVDADEHKLAFFLSPPTVSQVKKVAQAGERMPHKSTYFYPKLLTGLVISALEDVRK